MTSTAGVTLFWAWQAVAAPSMQAPVQILRLDLAIIVTLLIQAVTLAYWGGNLSRTVKEHERRLKFNDDSAAILERGAATLSKLAAEALALSAEHQRRLDALTPDVETIRETAVIVESDNAEIKRMREKIHGLATQVTAATTRLEIIHTTLQAIDERCVGALQGGTHRPAGAP